VSNWLTFAKWQEVHSKVVVKFKAVSFYGTQYSVILEFVSLLEVYISVSASFVSIVLYIMNLLT